MTQDLSHMNLFSSPAKIPDSTMQERELLEILPARRMLGASMAAHEDAEQWCYLIGRFEGGDFTEEPQTLLLLQPHLCAAPSQC